MSEPLTTTVVLTSYHDPRIRETLASLDHQTRAPDEILIADGSVEEGFQTELAELAAVHGAEIVHEDHASVARARNLALQAATGDVLIFLDTDQQAPQPWLHELVAPIEEDRADWTGGPTRPSVALELMRLKEERLYAAAAVDPTRIPMGNSAWRAAIFEEIGGFDERLDRGGEDWDVAQRAAAAGFQGQLVEQAWVHHDITGLDTYRKVAKKQFRYNVGGAMAYLKNRGMGERAKQRYPKPGWHWFDLVEPVLKAVAVPVAWWRLRRMEET